MARRYKIDPNFALAYVDAWSDRAASEFRDLDWRGSEWMTPAEWTEQAELIVPGYNVFDAREVGRWLQRFSGIKVQPAREGSVALYVKGSRATLEKMKELARYRHEFPGGGPEESEALGAEADEASIQDGELRLWWD